MEVLVTMMPLTEEQFESFGAEDSSITDKFLIRDCPCDAATLEAEVRGPEAARWWDNRDKVLVSDQIVTVKYVRQSSRCEVATSRLLLRPEAPGSAKMVGSSRVLAEASLTLINNSTARQAFKIRTTARDRYRVEPSCGMVEAAARFPVLISMVQPRGAGSDKFQVRCCAVGEDEVELVTDVKSNEWCALPRPGGAVAALPLRLPEGRSARCAGIDGRCGQVDAGERQVTPM